MNVNDLGKDEAYHHFVRGFTSANPLCSGLLPENFADFLPGQFELSTKVLNDPHNILWSLRSFNFDLMVNTSFKASQQGPIDHSLWLAIHAVGDIGEDACRSYPIENTANGYQLSPIHRLRMAQAQLGREDCLELEALIQEINGLTASFDASLLQYSHTADQLYLLMDLPQEKVEPGHWMNPGAWDELIHSTVYHQEEKEYYDARYPGLNWVCMADAIRKAEVYIKSSNSKRSEHNLIEPGV